MLDYLYEWLRNLAFYLVIVTAVLHTLPTNAYKKYIRFFTGLVLILMLLTPVFHLFKMEYKVSDFYEDFDYEGNRKRIEEEVNQHLNSGIEVEEIVIGP